MPRLFLTVVVGLVVLVATFAVMVAASVDADPPHYGMDTILNGTHAATHTPLLAETNTVTVSRASSDSGTFEPIRIGTFFDSLYIPSMYCSSASESVVEYDTVTIPCSESAILTDAKRDVLINELVPAAVKLLEERLLVRRRAGPIKVPAYGLETHCGHFAIPNTHRTDGVSGYDVIFHVAAKPNNPGVEAWAFQCTNAPDGDQRALVVALNVDPQALDDATDMGVRTVVREMIHGLGFTSDNFQKRGLLGKQTVRGKPDTTVLLANNVLQPIWEEHFQCPNVQYMELATNDIGQLVWTERTMNDDIMTNFPRSGYISAITLGALEATGAYRGVYKKAEVSPWGRGSGCAFLDEPCLTNKVALPNTQFCTNTDFSLHCSPTRRAVAQCDSWTHQPSETWASGYGLWSANDHLDYCPTFDAYSIACESGGSSVPDSLDGEGTLCLDATQFGTTFGIATFGVCAQVRCNSDKSYDVKVKGDSDYRRCTSGQPFWMTSESTLSRLVVCPPIYEVCRMTREELGISDDLSSIDSTSPLLTVTLTWVMCAALIVVWWL